MWLSLLFIILCKLAVITNSKCTIDSESVPPRYHLIEKCYRSKLGIVAKANYTSLTSCHRLGIEKKGLAVNFSPREAWRGSYETVEYTCEVLKCTESEGGLSLVIDSRYDYYSIYANPIPHGNATCVPALGMFYIITKKLNYTQGLRECRNVSGVPADVTSEQRTDALAQLLAGANIEAAFVGLRSKNGSAFVSTTGDAVDCSIYRAWAPSHPRRHREKFECVLITRYRTWQSTPCKKNYPILCELIPRGPYKSGSIFASRLKKETTTENRNDEE